jgi:hypothetical protein
MGQIAAVKKYWEIIADNLSKAGWSWGCVSAIDSNGRTIWIKTCIAMTEKVSLCTRMKSSPRFWNWNLRSALAANWLDKLAGFFPHSAPLSRS